MFLRFASLLVLVASTATVHAAENWPRWRGPRGDGHVATSGLPVTWDASDVVWRVPLEGRGQSSPVVWGDRIFLTTALDEGAKRVVMCLDRRNGKLLWQQTVPWSGQPEKLHKMNSHASATCVTDGERVVAFFGRGGIHAYSVEGKHLWSQDLGPFDVNPWGTAACPVIVGDLVIQNCDNDVGAALIALNKNTGDLVWRRPRPDHRGWSTPILLNVEGRDQLLLNGHTGVKAYDPATGNEIWSCKSFNGRGEPTVTPGKELVYLVNGLAGDIYAVKPGGEGDVTSSRMAWHTPRRSGRDLPSPILIDNNLLVVSMSGVATCYDSQTGKILWDGRLGGNFSASPIAAGGLVYLPSESGETLVIRLAADKLDIVARNRVETSSDEIFRSSLAAVEGQLLLRSDGALYCIGKPAAGK
jgi:hypothetical protein